MSDKKPIEPCEHCRALAGGRRSTPAHKHLMPESNGEYSQHGKTTNEAHYVCSICGKKWLHETGNCGMGWSVCNPQ